VNDMEFEMTIYQYSIGSTIKVGNEEENGI
jgi:hypothetical protein